MCVCMQACMCIYSVFSWGSIVCLSKVIQGKTASTPDIVERDTAWFNGKQRLQSSKKLPSKQTICYFCFIHVFLAIMKKWLIILNHMTGF